MPIEQAQPNDEVVEDEPDSESSQSFEDANSLEAPLAESRCPGRLVGPSVRYNDYIIFYIPFPNLVSSRGGTPARCLRDSSCSA